MKTRERIEATRHLLRDIELIWQADKSNDYGDELTTALGALVLGSELLTRIYGQILVEEAEAAEKK